MEVMKRCIARSRSCTYHPSLSCKTVHDSAVDYLDSLAAPLLTDTVCVLKYRARDIQAKIRIFHMHTHKIRVFHVTHIVDMFFLRVAHTNIRVLITAVVICDFPIAAYS